MAWKFGNKVYRNLEEQVLENQKKSIKNQKDIDELKNAEPNGEVVLDLGTFYVGSFNNSQDVTDMISYKPTMGDLFTKTPPYKAISLQDDGSGWGTAETFYYDSQDWNYNNRYIEMRFVRSTALGDQKVLTLTYFYEEDRSTVYQITASIETEYDAVRRIIHDSINAEGIISGRDQILPTYGATTMQDYFKNVGYLVCEIIRADGSIMMAVCDHMTDDGFIYFALTDDPANATSHYLLSYATEIKTENHQLILYFDGFIVYDPLGLNLSDLNDIIHPVEFDYFDISVGSMLTLPYTGSQMLSHPNLNIKIKTVAQTTVENMYLKQGLYRDINGTVEIGFTNENSDYGATLRLEGRQDSNVFTVIVFNEV